MKWTNVTCTHNIVKENKCNEIFKSIFIIKENKEEKK